MVRTSEISDVPSSNQEKVDGNVEMKVKDEGTLPPPVVDVVGQPLNEQAWRVAEIVRSFLQMTQTAGRGGDESPAGDRCKAMVELVLKDSGKWSISKLETEHNHSLDAASSDDGSTKTAFSIGMVFDSVEAAKASYYDYGDKMGFQARTGSNRRSAGNRTLVMQRFLCSRGSYLLQRRNLGTSTGKRKRGPYRKRGKLLEEVEEKKDGDGDVVEVVDVESFSNKVSVADDDFGADVESRPSVKSSAGGDFGAEIGSGALMKSSVSSDDSRTPGAEVKNGGHTSATSVSAQSKLLRELGVRVYRYSSDEKRDIILRYLMKKNNRESGERTIKFFTTQPPPGENFQQQQTIQQQQNIAQQHDAGGNFTGWLPLQEGLRLRERSRGRRSITTYYHYALHHSLHEELLSLRSIAKRRGDLMLDASEKEIEAYSPNARHRNGMPSRSAPSIAWRRHVTSDNNSPQVRLSRFSLIFHLGFDSHEQEAKIETSSVDLN